jgi:hypothetical protein
MPMRIKYRDKIVDFNSDEKLPKKVFFVPKFTYRDPERGVLVLHYQDQGSWRADAWAGRIMRGMTPKDGIAR